MENTKQTYIDYILENIGIGTKELWEQFSVEDLKKLCDLYDEKDFYETRDLWRW